jgi:[ribosomal protein S5]-alanine N-acetyltransferase
LRCHLFREVLDGDGLGDAKIRKLNHFIETERLRLLPWRETDRRDFERLATDAQVVRFITGGIPYAADRVDEFLQRQMRQQEQFGYSLWRIVVKDTGQFAGFCGLQPIADTGEPEIGWWLLPEHWKKGIATEAGQSVLDWGFRVNRMPIVVAVANPANVASLAVMRRLGMKADGEMLYRGQRCARYSIRRNQWFSRGGCQN